MTPKEEFDPQTLLPLELRKTWFVVPRYRLHWAVLFFICLAAALALGVVGYVLDFRWMTWAPVMTYVVFSAVNLLLKGKDARCETEVRKYIEQTSPRHTA